MLPDFGLFTRGFDYLENKEKEKLRRRGLLGMGSALMRAGGQGKSTWEGLADALDIVRYERSNVRSDDRYKETEEEKRTALENKARAETKITASTNQMFGGNNAPEVNVPSTFDFQLQDNTSRMYQPVFDQRFDQLGGSEMQLPTWSTEYNTAIGNNPLLSEENPWSRHPSWARYNNPYLR